jgi:site-specific recombinase XerD
MLRTLTSSQVQHSPEEAKRARYQRGYFWIGHRKTGPGLWKFLWPENDLTGRRLCRLRTPRVVRPAAARGGIRKHIGWHTFRRSFATVLMAIGENLKILQ